jgi:hypothetical protein
MLWVCGGIGTRVWLLCWWSWLRAGLRKAFGQSLWSGEFGGRLGLLGGLWFGVVCSDVGVVCLA